MFGFVKSAISAVGDLFTGAVEFITGGPSEPEQQLPGPIAERPQAAQDERSFFDKIFGRNKPERGFTTIETDQGPVSVPNEPGAMGEIEDSGRGFNEPPEPSIWDRLRGEGLENQPTEPNYRGDVREVVSSAVDYQNYIAGGGDPGSYVHPVYGDWRDTAYQDALDYADQGWDGDDIVDLLLTDLLGS